MANSLLVTGAILGVNVRICAPKELFPSDEVVNYAKEFAKRIWCRINDYRRRC